MPGAAWARTGSGGFTLLIHRSRGPPSPSHGEGWFTSRLFATKSPAGSFHRKRSPFLPEEGWFGVAQNEIFCVGYQHGLDTCDDDSNDCGETRSSMWLRRRVCLFAGARPMSKHLYTLLRLR